RRQAPVPGFGGGQRRPGRFGFGARKNSSRGGDDAVLFDDLGCHLHRGQEGSARQARGDMSAFQDVEGNIFSTRSSGAGGHLTVHLSGCLDMETVSDLSVLLVGLDLDIARGLISEVSFGTEELY